MSQTPPPDPQPAAPNSTHAWTEGSLPAPYNVQAGPLEGPLPPHGHRAIVHEPLPIIHTRRVSIQEPTPAGTHQLHVQERLPTLHSRRVSIQEPAPPSARRVSSQEPAPPSTRRVSIQEQAPPSTHWVSSQEPAPPSTRRVSIQEPAPPSAHRVSSQEPAPPSTRRVSIQERAPPSARRVSIQEPEPPSARRVSVQDTLPATSFRRLSTQDTPPVTYNRWVSTRDAPSAFPNRHLSNQSSHLLINIKSDTSISHSDTETWTWASSLSLLSKQSRARVDVPPSITHSPEASVDSMQSWSWDSESYKDSSQPSQPEVDTYSFLSLSSIGTEAGRFQDNRRRQSRLSISWRLLHEARKKSRQLSLVLGLLGMGLISLISLGQPWMHFRVPLRPPGDPAGALTIPINTIFFVRCPDVSCRHEYDKNAYLLDLSWAFLLISTFTSFCLCVALISAIFFSSSNLPVLDFFLLVCSILTGTSIVLGVLFYLLQADEYLQEGMTYKLGISFYLSWAAISLFLLTGLFSYLNYINFWSILAIQAIWS